jgi:XTP/dITP diphosphohydrolase
MESQRILVLGTHNKKKRQELETLLVGRGLTLHTLDDYPSAIEVVEDGETFAANACKKASEQAKHLGRWVLGEDSGLAVHALGGAPGVYSARYSGSSATDASNNAKLLAELAKTPLEKRTAHYVCHAALADPSGAIRAESEGMCRGRMLFTAVGDGGFGYDPLFEIVEYHLTFGQLGPAVKAVLSHRSRAMRQIVAQIASLVE